MLYIIRQFEKAEMPTARNTMQCVITLFDVDQALARAHRTPTRIRPALFVRVYVAIDRTVSLQGRM